LGFVPDNPEWFDKALTHPYLNKKDNQGREYNYDRLEFLGDAVISLVVSEYLFTRLPDYPEGKLSDLRARIVSRKNLNRIGRELRLKNFFKGHSRHQLGENLEGNVLEALTGAVYMDQGFDKAKEFVNRRIIEPYVRLDEILGSIGSHKNALVKWAQKNKKDLDFRTYKHTAENGNTVYTVKVFINGKFYSFGKSGSKKKAQEIAARYAYKKITGRSRSSA